MFKAGIMKQILTVGLIPNGQDMMWKELHANSEVTQIEPGFPIPMSTILDIQIKLSTGVSGRDERSRKVFDLDKSIDKFRNHLTIFFHFYF